MITTKFDNMTISYDKMTIKNLNRSKENCREMYDWHKKFKNENAADDCIKTSLNQH